MPLVMHLFLPVLLVLVGAMQQVLQLVVQEVTEVLLGEVLQLALLELLAWMGGAWRGREGYELGSFDQLQRVPLGPQGLGKYFDSFAK